MQEWLSAHWVQIGVVWFFVQNLLKAVQDAEDVEPAGLKPLAKVSYYMNSIGNYLFLGNRVQSIK